MPALVRSDASPGKALLSTLSVLRQPTPTDHSPLGSWDRYPYRIRTIFDRYVRVFDGPRQLQVAFFPAINCTFSGDTDSGSIALMMLVLGNNTPVYVGTARQIQQGPALPGIEVDGLYGDQSTGWLQAVVVPDGIARVVLKFTPPHRQPYSSSVAIHSNVGLVLGHISDGPTTVLWYGKNGRLLKTLQG